MHRRQMQGLSRTDSNQLCSELHKRWRTRSSSWEFFCVCVVDFHVSFSQCGQDANFCLDSSAVCGVCPSGSICELKFGQCVEVTRDLFCCFCLLNNHLKKKLPPCNPSIPICNPNTRPNDGGQYFCNSNCLWTELNEPLVEIVPNEEVEIHDTFTMFWRFFDASNCAIPEGCAVPGSKKEKNASDFCLFDPVSTGWNLLLKFDTRISNIGTRLLFFRMLFEPFLWFDQHVRCSSPV
jgi:hypothetical protein